MTTLNATNTVLLSTLLSNIRKYKTNPSAIQRLALETLEIVTNGSVDIVDPTNPALFVMETSAVNSASAVLESEVACRRLYPILAQNEQELYRHMSDKDFLNRFAVPSKTTATFVINLDDLLDKMIADPELAGSKYVTIPRNSTMTVGGIVFQMEYPVDIRIYSNGILEVSYNTKILSPILPIETNIINYLIRTDASGVRSLFFDVDIVQVAVTSTQYIIQSSTYFEETLDFTDQYYYCRVYYKSTATQNTWKEIKTTHTDQVYDPYSPTVSLKVTGSELTIFIPPIYVNSQQIDGTVRVDVYTTKGSITLDMSTYTLSAFTSKLTAIDDVRDINGYTNAMVSGQYIMYSDKLVSGGTDGISFEQLREQVINNVTGEQQLPITNVQIIAYAQNYGFDIVKNYDHVTNRIFLATKKLPIPSNPKLITPANIMIGTSLMSFSQIKESPTVFNNVKRITLPSNTLYASNNGIISLYPDTELANLNNKSTEDKVAIVNSNKFLYTPWYYVFDNSDQFFDSRAYHLDNPALSNLNFIAQNPSLTFQVSSSSYTIQKISTGYEILISVLSDDTYKNTGDDYFNTQLAFIPKGESEYAYLNGKLIGRTTANERIFKFIVATNHDITKSNNLVLTNFEIYNHSYIEIETPLTNTFTIFYTTTFVSGSGYVADPMDKLIGNFLLPVGSCGITQETITITFGTALDNLWTQARSYIPVPVYDTYSEDVPMTYSEDVYAIDPVTKSIFSIDENGKISYKLLHTKGEIVYNDDGERVLIHRKGDYKYNEQNKPVLTVSDDTIRSIDLMLIDGSYYFATDIAYIDYKKEISSILNTWIAENISNISDILLEQTQIYYYPKNALGHIDVTIDDTNTVSIEAEQSFVINLYVTSNVYANNAIRTNIETISIKTLESLISSRMVSMNDIMIALKSVYGSSVISFDISGLGGSKNYTVVSLINGHEVLSLKKHLVIQDNGETIVKEDVTCNFISYQA